MTTLIPVVKSTVGAPQFTVTLDGNQYNVQVRWSLYGQRYYIVCYDINGVLQFSVPLIESEVGVNIISLVFDEITGVVSGTTSAPHGHTIAATLALTITGASPDAYNGKQLVLITGVDTFRYPLTVTTDPGAATVQGTLSYDISMCAGYFASTLVFRNTQFEVNP